jgi:hypothetical protein
MCHTTTKINITSGIEILRKDKQKFVDGKNHRIALTLQKAQQIHILYFYETKSMCS